MSVETNTKEETRGIRPKSLLEAAVITLLHSSVLKLGVLTGEGGLGMAGIYD